MKHLWDFMNSILIAYHWKKKIFEIKKNYVLHTSHTNHFRALMQFLGVKLSYHYFWYDFSIFSQCIANLGFVRIDGSFIDYLCHCAHHYRTFQLKSQKNKKNGLFVRNAAKTMIYSLNIKRGMLICFFLPFFIILSKNP